MVLFYFLVWNLFCLGIVLLAAALYLSSLNWFCWCSKRRMTCANYVVHWCCESRICLCVCDWVMLNEKSRLLICHFELWLFAVWCWCTWVICFFFFLCEYFCLVLPDLLALSVFMFVSILCVKFFWIELWRWFPVRVVNVNWRGDG